MGNKPTLTKCKIAYPVPIEDTISSLNPDVFLILNLI